MALRIQFTHLCHWQLLSMSLEHFIYGSGGTDEVAGFRKTHEASRTQRRRGKGSFTAASKAKIGKNYPGSKHLPSSSPSETVGDTSNVDWTEIK